MSLRKIYRVTTFVAPEPLEALLKSIGLQAALQYGKYDQAAWSIFIDEAEIAVSDDGATSGG